eukprot:Opistho-2@84374
MSDNPFAEPDDDNRTVIRPNPGRRRAAGAQPTRDPMRDQAGKDAAPQTVQAPAVAAAGPVAEGTENLLIGNDVLAAAAAPLLQLMARLRNTVNPPESGDLRERTVRQIRRFEQEARDKGCADGPVASGAHVLCVDT